MYTPLAILCDVARWPEFERILVGRPLTEAEHATVAWIRRDPVTAFARALEEERLAGCALPITSASLSKGEALAAAAIFTPAAV